MKTAKKYPLLISIIVSCVLVVASLFILGFFGINLGTSLAGGSQFETGRKYRPPLLQSENFTGRPHSGGKSRIAPGIGTYRFFAGIPLQYLCQLVDTAPDRPGGQ